MRRMTVPPLIRSHGSSVLSIDRTGIHLPEKSIWADAAEGHASRADRIAVPRRVKRMDRFLELRRLLIGVEDGLGTRQRNLRLLYRFLRSGDDGPRHRRGPRPGPVFLRHH